MSNIVAVSCNELIDAFTFIATYSQHEPEIAQNFKKKLNYKLWYDGFWQDWIDQTIFVKKNVQGQLAGFFLGKVILC